MATRVILETRIREDAVDEAKAFFQRVIPDARVYDGCLYSNMFQDEKEPTSLLMVEDWESLDHHRRYLNWCTRSGVLREMLRLMSGPPSLRYYHTLDL
ncbi:MAG TPA: antibiotic biosynthesis monooxygenase family protein [Pontibacter sp.]